MPSLTHTAICFSIDHETSWPQRTKQASEGQASAPQSRKRENEEDSPCGKVGGIQLTHPQHVRTHTIWSHQLTTLSFHHKAEHTQSWFTPTDSVIILSPGPTPTQEARYKGKENSTVTIIPNHWKPAPQSVTALSDQPLFQGQHQNQKHSHPHFSYPRIETIAKGDSRLASLERKQVTYSKLS